MWRKHLANGLRNLWWYIQEDWHPKRYGENERGAVWDPLSRRK